MIRSKFFEFDRSFILALVALLLATTACQLNIGGPEIPTVDAGSAAQDAGSLQEQWEAAFSQAAGGDGQVQLIISEQQLTSYLQNQLTQQSDPIIQQPTVRLRDGQIMIYGTAQQNWIRAQLLVEMRVDVTPSGEPTFEIISAEFGPLPLPDPIKDGIELLIAEAFAGSVGPYITGFQLETIAIADGEMALIGELR